MTFIIFVYNEDREVFMKDKKKLIKIGGAVLVVLIIVLVLILVLNQNKTKNVVQEPECPTFTGGAYNLVFNTNGGNKIENMSVCIACSPDSYKSLPTPKKNKKKFSGWYYDEALTQKVDVKTTLDITPIEEIDANGCKVGYKDITLYAKWK